ncbi:acyl-CoA synthetase (AMP-forming)/AMP-acid ligase II [Bradyrhizobium sp. LM6.10]
MNLAHHLLRAAKADASAPALLKGLTPVADYGRLAATVASLAASLQQRFGLAKGDRVALLMKNVPDYVACLYACWHAGLVAVPINAKLHPREVAFILDNSGAAVVFVTEDMASVAFEASALVTAKPRIVEIGSAEHRGLEKTDGIAIADVVSTDPAWIFYTSGTTGRPKGAVLSHRNLLAMALNYLAEINPVVPGEALLHAAPMSHGSGLYMVPHVLGLGAQIIPESGRFEPDEILELTAKRDRISFFAAPTMVRRLTVAAEAAGATAPGREDDHLWRRPDVCRRLQGCAQRVRAKACADLRSGRNADDHHVPAKVNACRCRASASCRAAGVGWRRAGRRTGAHRE